MVAAAHHERGDGSGYHRGVPARDLPPEARLLAAADVFAALTEPRPQRPTYAPAAAADIVAAQVADGLLDPEACAAVTSAAGTPRVRAAWPCGLTGREVEVLPQQHREAAMTVSPSTAPPASTDRPSGVAAVTAKHIAAASGQDTTPFSR